MMQLIDKSNLVYTNVYPADDPNNLQAAVLASDINSAPYIEIKQFANNTEIDIASKDIHDEKYQKYKLSDDDALEILHIVRKILGLSRIEKEAIDVACKAIEYRQGKNIV